MGKPLSGALFIRANIATSDRIVLLDKRGRFLVESYTYRNARIHPETVELCLVIGDK